MTVKPFDPAVAFTASLMLLQACTGSIQPTYGADPGEPETAFPDGTERPTRTDVPPPAADEPDGFRVPRDSRVLLPFDVRLGRLAAVLGVDPEDGVLAPVRAARSELGAHDFANGVSPELTWNASKMSLWVDVLTPICASSTMRDQYPELTAAADLRALMSVAYGREVEVEAAEELLADFGDATYELRCLTVLSSAEFVLR